MVFSGPHSEGPVGRGSDTLLQRAQAGNGEGFKGGFPGGSDGKESACNAGDPSLISALGISPGGGHGNPLQYSCLENPHGPRSLMGYSPWDWRVGHN